MWTTRKQFPVNWLTSERLTFTIQRPKARRSQQMKQWRPKTGGTMWRDFELINCPSTTKKHWTYHRNWLKLLHTKGSFTSNGRNRLKQPRENRFCWTAGKRTSCIAARPSKRWTQNVRVLQGRSYKRPCGRIFYWKRKGKNLSRFRVFLSRTWPGILWNTPCLNDILFRTSHWIISNYSLLNTRLIEAEYSRRGKYS